MTEKSLVVCKIKFENSLDHYKRHEKTSNIYVKKCINGMFNYFKDEKKNAVNMFDYFQGKITDHGGIINIVKEDGEYATDKEIEKRKKDYIKYFEKSNLWKGFVSFNSDYINDNISIRELEKIITTKVMPKFLVKAGFKDPNKMSYQIAVHMNTDNIHFHFSFIEKEPNFLDHDGKLGYRRTGKFKANTLDFFKNEIILNIEKEKYFKPKIISINKDIDEMKKYFKPGERNFILKDIDDIMLEENVLNLGKMIYEKRNGKQGKIKFNSIEDKEIKNLTKNIKRYLFKNKKSELYNMEGIFKNDLNNLNEYLYDINRRNNIKGKKRVNSIVSTKEEYMDNFIYNAIINHSSYLYGRLKENKKYVSGDKVIQEAVLNVYKKNVRQSRLTIIKNYLSNITPQTKFPNKAKIEQTIKKLNDELEDAKTEFSKLFSEDYYK